LSHGPGGNTSIKINDSIYVKLSGTSLKDSLKKKSFIVLFFIFDRVKQERKRSKLFYDLS